MATKAQQVFGQYIHQRISRISHSWKTYLATGGAEHLHTYRVEVKKLLALLHFVKWAAPGFKLKRNSRFIANSFKRAGAIRDDYNYQLLAKKFKYTIPAPYSQSAATETQHSLKQLKKRYTRSRHKLQEMENALGKTLRHLTIKQLQEYVHHGLTEITGQIGQGLKNEMIHELRKKLKDIYYLQKILAAHKKGLPVNTVKHINTLQDLAGKWHDIEKFRRAIANQNKRPVKTLQLLTADEKKLLAHIHQLSLGFLHPVQ